MVVPRGVFTQFFISVLPVVLSNGVLSNNGEFKSSLGMSSSKWEADRTQGSCCHSRKIPACTLSVEFWRGSCYSAIEHTHGCAPWWILNGLWSAVLCCVCMFVYVCVCLCVVCVCVCICVCLFNRGSVLLTVMCFIRRFRRSQSRTYLCV